VNERRTRAICWVPTWNEARKSLGLEQLLLSEQSADSVVLAFDERGDSFRLVYRLRWDQSWRIRAADLEVSTGRSTRSLSVETDGAGHWRCSDRALSELAGCLDLDIWPTPFTNSFPIRRVQMKLGERTEFRMAWIAAPELTIQPRAQAYTRLSEQVYRFESLDGSGFTADLTVDDAGVVLDYPGLFRRVGGRFLGFE
jgi:hypothetical protein